MGCQTLTVNVEKVDELLEAIKAIGSATDKGPQAESLVNQIKGELESLSRKLSEGKKVRVLWVVQREPLRVAGRDTFINELIELAGGENAIGPTVHKYPPIGIEQVIACNADVIIEPAMTGGVSDRQHRAALQYWGRFSYLPAVKNHRIYIVDADTVSRLGPRIGEGVSKIARCLHPELFGNPNL